MCTCGNRSSLVTGMAELPVQGVAWLSMLLLININIINCLVAVGMVGVCEAAIMTAPVDCDELN